MKYPNPLHTSRRETAAHRYAMSEGNKSDPFAFLRAMTHLRAGICDERVTSDGTTHECHYDATRYEETRKLPDGREYVASVYRDAKRPYS